MPPLTNGKLRLYAMRYCPYAERAMIALSVKNIPHEVVNIHLQEKPAWYLERNPMGKVPALEKDGKVIYESLVVAEYLDEVYPEKPLLPKDPYERARQKILTEHLTKLPSAMYPAYRNPKDPKVLAAIDEALGYYESLLQKDNFFCGKEPGWADYMAWPWVERLNAANAMFEGAVKLDKFPKLVAYIERMKARPEIQRVIKSDKAHAEFLSGAFATGKPNYDIECDA